MNDIRVLKQNVEKAIKLFIQNDTELLNLKVYELAVSHRIAVYLEQIFKDKELNFDCEYDKHYKKKKIDPNGKPIRPDILVHKRNSDVNNIIAIEIKKDRKSKHDFEKLKALTFPKNNNESRFEYQLGVFVYFPNGEPQFKWFEGGMEK